jgi:hypothetical protein
MADPRLRTWLITRLALELAALAFLLALYVLLMRCAPA